MIYTVTLNPSLDYIMYVPDIKLGTVCRAESETIYPGGKGVNVSVLLSRLDIENRCLGFTAGFSGKAIEQMLQTYGITPAFIRLSTGNSRINVKIRSDIESDINAQGPPITERDLLQLIDFLNVLTGSDFLVLSGSVPNTLPNNTYEKIIQSVIDSHVSLVVDAAGELLKSTLQYNPFLIKPNQEELAELFDAKIETEEDVVKYAIKAQKLGAKNVMISRGSYDTILLTESGNILKATPPDGKVKNTVGAGDSMVAGFLAGWLKTSDYQKALNLGTAAGSATAFNEWIAEKEDIKRLITIDYL